MPKIIRKPKNALKPMIGVKTISAFIGEEVMRCVGAVTDTASSLLRSIVEVKRLAFYDALSKADAFTVDTKTNTKVLSPKLFLLDSELKQLEERLDKLVQSEALASEDKARTAQAEYDRASAESKAKTVTEGTNLLLAPVVPQIAPITPTVTPPKSTTWIRYAGAAAVLGVAYYFYSKRK